MASAVISVRGHFLIAKLDGLVSAVVKFGRRADKGLQVSRLAGLAMK